MTFAEIREMPTSINEPMRGSGWHESVTRSYHILEKIMVLVQLDTPVSVILEIYEDLKNG